MTREETIKRLENIADKAAHTIGETPFVMSVDDGIAVKEAIKAVQEQRTGHWVLDEAPHDGDCRCTACGIAIDAMNERNHGLLNALTNGKWWKFYKYCPECGAKMESEEQDDDR